MYIRINSFVVDQCHDEGSFTTSMITNFRFLSKQLHTSRSIYKTLAQSPYYNLILGDIALNHNYDINTLQLKKQFLNKQKLYHPDAQTGKSDEEAAHALQTSSLVNKAYETLLHPLSRAVYILELNGIEIGEADSVEDPDLLMEILDLREQLEEATSEDQVRSLRETNKEAINSTINDVSAAFQNENYEDAKNLTIKLRYLTNLDTAAKDWQPGAPVILQH
ncbi:hypothetical protein E3Q23_01050 [Wallemia mellicola]|nr:hypothetical protein E3Q23_01050 [Wallemia mellicola]TIB93165.1 Co-chaperone Hsc20 [Wallemia mellicola]TIC29510.1 Co-chaperone Hsc20 [Wallemia mellicola]